MWFAYFDFMHERGWLSTEGRPCDYAVATAPVWALGAIMAIVLWLTN